MHLLTGPLQACPSSGDNTAVIAGATVGALGAAGAAGCLIFILGRKKIFDDEKEPVGLLQLLERLKICKPIMIQI